MKNLKEIEKLIKNITEKFEKADKFVNSDTKNEGKYKKMIFCLSAVGISFAALYFVREGQIAKSLIIYSVWQIMAFAAPYAILLKKEKKMKTSVEIELPDFMDRTALLIESGMQVKKAIYSAAIGSNNPLCRDVKKIFEECERNGSIEDDSLSAMEKLSAVYDLSAVNAFVSILTLNMHKGADTICETMRIQAKILRNERQNVIKRLGEEAATYMIFPSAVIFAAIMAMMITPAIMMLK